MSATVGNNASRSIAALILGILLLANLNCNPSSNDASRRATTPLHEMARDGRLSSVEVLIGQGENVNALDEEGKSPLHWAAANGHVGTVSALLNAGADPGARDDHGMTPFDYANANGHSQTADEIARAIGNEGSRTPSASEAATPSGLNPSLKYVNLPSFETAIGQPGCLLQSDRIWMFAPKFREDSANVVFPYLVNAYDVLRGIVGVDTEYVIVVYNFPEGSKEAFGGTSNCAIYYDDTNLQLDRYSEWTQYGVPHVSGYIE
ncbi:MAG: ankyrin repeat domain-containing protein, partial [Candidatus Hydrogenedentes bacterium]|nr:ankyrin repeat domain-containing protein [Candidatus Hydrogenedentota bacterium]